MAAPLSPTQRLRSLFEQKKCWMLAQLAQALHYAPVSVRRLLAKTGYFRSFTHNGKWYTLEDLPEFNAEGIWHHNDIGFSKNGSLTGTILYLVDRSPAGLSAAQLSQKLSHPCHPVLTYLYKDGKLDRTRLAGEFRYLSVKPRLHRRQLQRCTLEGQAAPQPQPLSTQQALFVLVEHLKSPGADFDRLARRVQKQRGLKVTAASIASFFEKEGLKKTPERSARRR